MSLPDTDDNASYILVVYIEIDIVIYHQFGSVVRSYHHLKQQEGHLPSSRQQMALRGFIAI